MNPITKKRNKKRSFSFVIPSLAALILCFQLSGCDPSSLANESTLIERDSPASSNSQSPRLSQDLSGNPLLSWIDSEGKYSILKYSIMTQGQWSPSQEVARGSDWVVNGADTPSVVQLANSLLAAHWLVENPDAPFAYDIFVSHSVDMGKTWSKPVTPHLDGTATEHGFVSLYKPVGEGDKGYGAVWLDGRHTSGKTPAEHGYKMSGVALRSAMIGLDGSIYEQKVIDDLVCDCCPTALTQGPHGPIVVYRNRDQSEQRDIFYAQLSDGQWSKPSTVGFDDWHITGCPVNGPATSSVGNTLAVAWFTAAGGRKSVRLAISQNAGLTFEPSVEVDHGDILGRVSLTMNKAMQVSMSWLTVPRGSEFAALQLATFSLEGSALSKISQNSITLATKKPIGVPVLAALAEGAGVLAWTGGGVRSPKVRVFVWGSAVKDK